MTEFHSFSPKEIRESFRWLNEPPKWNVRGGRLLIIAAANTDLFRSSRVGGRDEAAFLYRPIEGDFRFAAKLSATTRKFADAGGLLLRASRKIWCKLCLEQNEYGDQTIVSVATNRWSDDVNHQAWPLGAAFFRITRVGNEVALHVSSDDKLWPLSRCLTLPLPASVDIGFLAQSPFGRECQVEFSDWFVDDQVDADFRSGK
jgi:regulation of enolase protein 1 (concanavalin A-like superfamily)